LLGFWAEKVRCLSSQSDERKTSSGKADIAAGNAREHLFVKHEQSIIRQETVYQSINSISRTSRNQPPGASVRLLHSNTILGT